MLTSNTAASNFKALQFIATGRPRASRCQHLRQQKKAGLAVDAYFNAFASFQLASSYILPSILIGLLSFSGATHITASRPIIRHYDALQFRARLFNFDAISRAFPRAERDRSFDTQDDVTRRAIPRLLAYLAAA